MITMKDVRNIVDDISTEEEDDETTLQLYREQSRLLEAHNTLLRERIALVTVNKEQDRELICQYKEQSNLLEQNNILLRQKLEKLQNDVAALKTAIRQQEAQLQLSANPREHQSM